MADGGGRAVGMLFEAALRGWLAADVVLNGHLKGALYPNVIPDKVGYPALVVGVEMHAPPRNYGRRLQQTRRITLMLTTQAKDYESARVVTEALITKLQNFAGDIGGGWRIISAEENHQSNIWNYDASLQTSGVVFALLVQGV